MAVSSVTIENPIDPQSISTNVVRPQIIASFVGGTPNYDILWEWDDDVTFANGNGRRVQETDTGITTDGRYSKAPSVNLDVADGRTFFTRVTVTDNNGGGTPVASGIHDLVYADPNPDTRSHLATVANVGVAFLTTDLPIETQRISHDGTGGTFTLSFSGQGPTGAINWNATSTDIKTALELLSNITTVNVEKHADGDWIVEFVDVSPEPIPAMTADDTLLTGDIVGVVITVHIDDVTPWGTGGTAGADGDEISFRRYLALVGNVGVGFEPTDKPGGGWGEGIGGTVGPDGDVIDFRRHLGLVANVDTTQPCPSLFSLSVPQAKVGESITVKGQGLVSASAPTADAWDAEVRLYATPSFSASFVTLSITDWTAGSLEDEIVATIPGGATSGFIAVVHTTTPSCSGSNFIGLTVIAKDPDRQAGWWAEVWDLKNVTKLVSPIPLVSEATFEHIANDIGNGAIFLRGDDEDVDDIIDRSINPETQSLVKIYLHDRFAYSFIPDDSEEEYDDDGARTVRLFGTGQERILKWGRCLWKDFPAQPSVTRTWLYGSTANQIPWGDMEADSEIDNRGIEDAATDPAVAVGTAGLFADTGEARTGAYSLRVTPVALNDGVEWEISVEERRAFADLWFKVNIIGGTYITELLAEDDTVVDSAVTVTASAAWISINLDAIPSSGETWRLRITQTAGTLAQFWVDDVAAYARIGGTFELNRATYQLSRTHVAQGLHSMELAMDAGGNTSFNGMVIYFPVVPNEEYTVGVPVSGTAGEIVRVATRIGGTVDAVEQALTALGTFDVITVTGTAGSEETTARLAISSKEIGAMTVYLDDLTITPGAAAANAGVIVTDVHTVMVARGTLDFVSLNFDATLDSGGLAWPETLPFEVDPAWTMWDLLEKLIGLGYSVELAPVNWREGGDTGWELNLYSPLSAGVDWSSFDDGPAILPGDTIRDVEPSSAPPAETVAYGEGAGGIWTVATASAARITALERREAFVKAIHAKDSVTLFRVVSHRLDVSLTKGEQWTGKLTDDADPLPYFDFLPHDRLRAHLPTDGSRDAVLDATYLTAAITFRGTGEGIGQEYEADFGKYKLYAQRLRDLILARQLQRESSENYQPGTGSISSAGGGGSTPAASDAPDIVAVSPHDHVWSDVGPAVGGDLAGSFPSPQVAGLRGRRVSPTAPADTEVLTYDTAALEWGPAAGGGAGAIVPFWKAAVVGTYDDYFDSDQSADWTAVAPDTGSAIWSYHFATRLGETNRGFLADYDDQVVGDFGAQLKLLSGIAIGDWIQTSLVHFGPSDQYRWGGVVLSDGATPGSNAVSWSIMGDNTLEYKVISGEGTLTNHIVHGVNLYRHLEPGHIHLRLIYQAADTFRCQISLNGETWRTIGSDLSETFTPTHGGLLVTTYGGVNPMLTNFRYFHSNATP